MKKNMGTADRAIRSLIAVGIVALYLTGRIGGTLAIVLGIVAVVFLLTSFVGHCPGYVPIKVSTRKEGPGAPGA